MTRPGLRRAGLAAALLGLGLAFAGCAHAADPVSRLCRPDATKAPAREVVLNAPQAQASEMAFSETPGFEDRVGTLVGEPIVSADLRYEDVVATGPIWLFTSRGLAIGKVPLRVIVGQKTPYGWKAFVQESACFEETLPAAVLSAGPEGYDFASASRYGAVWYTLWNKPSGYETQIVAVTDPKTGPVRGQTLATLPLKVKALSIQPPLHDSQITFFMAGSRPQDPAVYLLQLSYKTSP